LDWLRSLPTEFAYWSLGERNTQELLHTVFLETLENSILGFYFKGDSSLLLQSAAAKNCYASDY
jgi:hypothetical protein